MISSRGLHHITAVAKDPQRNVDFYQQVLGQRLVKTTVNFDDPGTYHFYYADRIGTPGSLLTFFPWQHVGQGRAGNGETTAVAYTIQPDSLEFWRQHLSQFDLEVEDESRFGEQVLVFTDPDGMRLELVATHSPAKIQHWQEGPVPEEHALRGFHGVTLWLHEVQPTADILIDHLGYRFVGQEDNRYRYQSKSNDIGSVIDIVHRPGAPIARFGAGSVHHIAFRCENDAQQLAILDELRSSGQNVTAMQDRQYFRSIYFRSPGGVLFEIATDAPGFQIDEPVEQLGQSLKLPPWLEQRRTQIEQTLPKFNLKPVTKLA